MAHYCVRASHLVVHATETTVEATGHRSAEVRSIDDELAVVVETRGRQTSFVMIMEPVHMLSLQITKVRDYLSNKASKHTYVPYWNTILISEFERTLNGEWPNSANVLFRAAAIAYVRGNIYTDPSSA